MPSDDRLPGVRRGDPRGEDWTLFMGANPFNIEKLVFSLKYAGGMAHGTQREHYCNPCSRFDLAVRTRLFLSPHVDARYDNNNDSQ